MHYLQKSTKPHGPVGFDTFLNIANRTAPFTSPCGQAFVSVASGAENGFLTFPVRSRAFREWFFTEAVARFKTVPTTGTWRAILHHLEAQASAYQRSRNIPVARRVHTGGETYTPEKVFLDLANPAGQFVEISPEGWCVTVSEHVHFETSPSTRTLPAPEKSDPQSDPPLDTLRTTLNLGAADSPDWLRCLAWLLSALRSEGPFPILVLRGPGACGKSTAARVLRSLVDPNASPITPFPASPQQLLNSARDNWILAFDHVSRITPTISDTLCRISSGVGVLIHEQGHHQPLQQFIRRPIILAVTNTWEPPPELASRCLVVTLPELPPESRREECDLLNTITGAVFPKILGALCSLIAQALSCPSPNLRPARTRHTTALAWSIAALPNLADQLTEAFEAPPPPPEVVQSVRALLNETPKWSGSATDLLQRVRVCQTPKGVTQHLNRHLLDFLDAGIQIQYRRLPGGARLIDLQDASQNVGSSSQASQNQELTAA